MKLVRLIAIIGTAVVAATLFARSEDGKNSSKTNDSALAPAPSNRSLKDPVKSVLEHYLKIHASLADDSTNGVFSNAVAISTTVKADQTKTFSVTVAEAADAVAKAKNLELMRENFKDLSKSLIQFLSDKKIKTGEFDEVFCPMANAYWLQTNADIANPYLGHSMPGCGQMKRTF